MYCAQCGTVVTANSRFCVGCGARVTDPAVGTTGNGQPGTISAEAELLATVRRALAADYDVEGEIGRGGMAVVFRARDRELDRAVALKVLPPELAPLATVADRFKREARLAASLEHPNIIPVYRVGHAGGVLYMAMKYIDGRSLDAIVMASGALSLSVVLTVMRSAARAVAYAHEQGIVHRDIKGANILIDSQGRVVVSDFGIARAVESSTLTATGVMMGTPHFMSPEQCAGKPVGPQSDQYALGVLAYQLLTGTVPFDGDSLPEILQHHWFTPPPDASLLRPDCPAALTAVIRRLLAKEPRDRFSSTNDLVTSLDAVPFPTAERANGEAELRALVARLIPTAEPAVAHPAPARAAPAATVRLDPTAPAPKTASSHPAAPTRPVAALKPGEAPKATERRPARVPPTPAPKARRQRWPIAVLVLLLIGAGVGAAGAAYRVRRSAHTTPAPAMPHLSASQLRDIGGRAYRAGDYELARRFFVRAIAADSSDRPARQALACTLAKLGRVDSARTIFATAGTLPDADRCAFTRGSAVSEDTAHGHSRAD